MTYHHERANEVYTKFCDDVLTGYLHSKFDIKSANIQIEEKRKLLESRWKVSLPIRLITE